MAENWIQSMNRCTGPSPCQCPITGPHRDDNPYCSRNRRTAHIRSVPASAGVQSAMQQALEALEDLYSEQEGPPLLRPKIIPIAVHNMPDCADKDEDCHDIKDKERCWVYAPERGMCPYLRSIGVDVPQGQEKDRG